jgi:lipopolysaccharide transport system ATP-binding protein
MTLVESTGVASAPESARVAVRANALSKTYAIWSSPTSRLTYPLLSMARRAVPMPASIAARLDRKRDRIFHEFHALEDISLEIKKGESWGFIGVNGSGKSTLLKIIAGNLRPTLGSVEVDGKVVILDYSSGLNGEFTGRENVYLKSSIFGLTRKQVDARFQSIADFADIGDFIDQPVKIYSSGMVARLGFAIMAHVEADIMITDEALAVGDAFFVQKCMAHIRDFLRRGTFLFVSHSIGDVVGLCQKAVWLEHGRIRAIGAAKDVADAYLSSNALAVSQRYLNELEPPPSAAADAVVEQAPTATTAAFLAQPRLGHLADMRGSRVVRDPRLDLLNRSPWRNDLEIPDFHLNGSGFGVGGARIEDVSFEDEAGCKLAWIIGAEIVRLIIDVAADRDLASPIVGFQVKDRLGQVLFADNTYLTTIEQPVAVSAGQCFQAEFCFQMPLLPVGEYVIRVAVAMGIESDNAMLHCIDNALVFRSTTSGARHGLVGVPMQHVRLGLSG